MSYQTQNIKLAEDERLTVTVEQDDRPTISLDIHGPHGRRVLSVRTDGMGLAGLLLDVKELPPQGRRIERFCPFCGTEINIFDSGVHTCEADL